MTIQARQMLVVVALPLWGLPCGGCGQGVLLSGGGRGHWGE